ncbi:helix-turn-helix domain-containing protein [Aureibaculum sp. 2210JD6-5]|uniref:helix-turn-helix domain-containing protein n=1 Tax=Aureibaculum sp. 2210JD6-5 TaxID=3103957 RepID=UPI002AAE0A7B|nr:helix-turn-helix domain-containing protein [Aureibaculum sp. 2210JD6-5]MDY7396402.1 helix-turn-helix domain-containing protein [Aureibaculum sp. 2210JD6-5]
MNYSNQNGAFIELHKITSNNCNVLKASKTSELSLLWFTSDNNQLIIDAIHYTFNKNDIISLTEFHKIEVIKINALQLIRWNRSFYCIVDHDSEVGCKGILYYGASNLPIIKPNNEDIDILQTVLKMLRIEFKSKDNLQLEMLQMMLKRLLILCTRIYKTQESFSQHEDSDIEIVREYNYLVETHFKEKHSVSHYADMLNKSPKTLANLFKKAGNNTPSHYIKNRIMLEARRLLTYTDKTISEIGYELGFTDVQVFSRFFKNIEYISPSEFRNKP